ncbi:MAG: ATP-dependent helicase [Deltaproteobacteria bacterium]|nr:ATP-dependent helicase [Deltaproteobacteria bacterium]
MELTPTQLYAVAHADCSAAIVAGAGSGKTAVIVGRIVHLLRERRMAPEQLCCITFTERAAAELKSRVARELGDYPATDLARAQVSTFHSLQARILREQSALTGIDPNFTTLDETAAALQLARSTRETILAELTADNTGVIQLVDGYRFPAVADWIAWLVDRRWDLKRFARVDGLPAPDADETTHLEAIRELTKLVEAAYDATKRQWRALDFADLELLTCDLLRRESAVRTHYQRLFGTLIVDEAQDVNANQEQFCRLLHAPGVNTLTIVGDPKQSIYRFRGADIEAFGRLVKYISEHGGERLTLQENFRSRPAICAFVNAASCDMNWFEPLIPRRPDGDLPQVVTLPVAASAHSAQGNGDDATARRDREAEAIANFIATALGDGSPGGDFALLFLAKTDMARYVEALQRLDIRCRVHSGGGFLERPEVLDLSAALRVAVSLANDEPCNAALLRVLRSPLIGCSDDDCYRLVFPDLTQANAPARDLRAASLADPRIGPLLTHWRNMAPHLHAGAMLETIIESTEYRAYCAAIDPSGQASANIEKLFWLTMRQPLPVAEWIVSFDEIGQRVARMPDQPLGIAQRDVVQLLTIHAAKGLEFRTVIVPDLIRQPRAVRPAWLYSPGRGVGLKLPEPDDPTAPKRTTPLWEELARVESAAEAAERQRLLYVALTRAQERLVLPIHEGLTRDKGTWHAHLKSLLREDSGHTPFVAPGLRRPAALALAGSSESLSCPSSMDRLRPRGDHDSRVESAANAGSAARLPASRHSGSAPLADSGGARRQDPPVGKGARCAAHEASFRRNFTVSELDTYAKCPMQYRLQYVEGIPGSLHGERIRHARQEQLSGAAIGDVLHETIRKLTYRSGADPAETLSATFRQMGFTPANADLVHATKLLASYTDGRSHSQYTTNLAEWPFSLQQGNAQIRGTIDLLGETAKGWEIVDYKTDRIENRGDIQSLMEEYELQMATYAIAAATAWGEIAVRQTVLVFLDSGDAVSRPVTAARLDAARKRLNRIIAEIRTGRFDIGGRRQLPCVRCPFHHNRTCWEDRLQEKK